MLINFLPIPSFYPIGIFEEGSAITVSQGEITEFRVDLEIEPPNLDAKSRMPIIRVRDVSYFDNYELIDVNIDSICIDSLVLLQRYLDGGLAHHVNFLFEDGNKCVKVYKPKSLFLDLTFYDVKENEKQYFTEDVFFWIENFYYPYDNFSFQIAAMLKYRFLDDKGNIIQNGISIPYMTIFTLGSPEWDRNTVKQDSKFTETFWLLEHDVDYSKTARESLYIPYLIKFSRPLFLQIVFPILTLSLFIFIAFLSSVDKPETFIEGSLAVLLGVFGIRNILIPNDISVRTIVDVGIVSLYGAFGLCVVIQVTKYIRNYHRGY